jgi:hypothetical protein
MALHQQFGEGCQNQGTRLPHQTQSHSHGLSTCREARPPAAHISPFLPTSYSEEPAFGLKWRRAPAHTAIRYILQGLDPAAVEAVFRRHAAQLHAARGTPGQRSIALDGKTLRGSFDNFHDRAAAQLLSAFATDTALVLAHVDIDEKSNEIPAAQALLAELGVAADTIVTLDALHCQKNCSRSPATPTSP